MFEAARPWDSSERASSGALQWQPSYGVPHAEWSATGRDCVRVRHRFSTEWRRFADNFTVVGN